MTGALSSVWAYRDDAEMPMTQEEVRPKDLFFPGICFVFGWALFWMFFFDEGGPVLWRRKVKP